ncbi:MAG: 50S ribosomal protein L15 [Armatimonadetes bacterium]|nr:50S ribosomal protein L15 [Armatimonadota bacterium]
MALKLHELKPAPGSVHRAKRKGRGIGSGNGKTAGRGNKGQKAHGQVRLGFEGGQTPLYRRLPLRKGFKNRFRKEFAIINIGQLNDLPENTEITPDFLISERIIKDMKDGLKILGDGDLTKPLVVRAHRFSKSAEEKIKTAGGTVEVI